MKLFNRSFPTTILTDNYSWILKLLMLSCIYLSSSEVQAATITWHGTDDDNWNNAANWSPITVPTASDDVIIFRQPGIAFNPVINSDVTVNSLEITSGDDLVVYAKLTINNTTGSFDGILVNGSLDVYGELEITSSQLNGLRVNSNGTANIYGNTLINTIGVNGIYVAGDLFIGKDATGSVPTIEIYGCGDDGIFISSNGEVEIDKATVEIGLGLSNFNIDFGIYNKNNFLFTEGDMIIRNANNDCFYNEGNTCFLNKGTATFSDSNSDAIQNIIVGYFLNQK